LQKAWRRKFNAPGFFCPALKEIKMQKLIAPATLITGLLLASAALAATPANPAALTQLSRKSHETVAVDQNRLLVMVRLPKEAKHTWVSDDTSTRFAGLAVRALHAQGFKGEIGTLGPEDSVTSHTSVLIINLINWTADKGVADCTFSASLRTSAGDRDLGAFSGDNVIVTADGLHRLSAEGLVGSALEAMNDLDSRLQATGLINAH
jgi:hypothetical protein